MAYSFVNYTGNGSTTSYSVPFTFIERDNVAVTVDGVSTTFSWVSDGQISISPAPAADTTIRIYRTTERNQRLVDFSDGATLNAENLDTADLQNFYLAQETLDYSDVGVLTDLVNDATASASAASSSEDAAAASATTAASSASSASTSAATATTQAGIATTQATAAASSATAAAASSATASTQATNATTSATSAASSASTATTQATNASTSASAASASATAAAGSASAASTSATNAATSASGASGSATSAASSASTATTQATDAAASATAAAASAASIAAITTTKGDLIVRDASSQTRLGVGSNGQILVADSAEAVGVKWATASTSTVFNVKDYGALGDNTTNDYTAIAAAITALTANGGGVLYFPYGRYKIGTALSITNVPIVIRGDGRDITWLIQTAAAANGVVFTSTLSGNKTNGHGSPRCSLKLSGLTIAAGAACNYGVLGTWVDENTNETLFAAEDVSVRNASSTSNYWIRPFHLIEPNGTRFNNVFLSGDEASYTTQADNPWSCTDGIYITSAASNTSISHILTNITGGNCGTFLTIDGQCEGVYLSGFEFVSVAYGIQALSGGLNLFTSNGHIDFRRQGLRATGWNNVQSNNVDLQRNGGRTSGIVSNDNMMTITTCEGLNLSNFRVKGYTSGGTGSQTENGISLVGVTRGVISNLRINDISNGSGILLDGTCAYINIINNVFAYCDGWGIYNTGSSAIKQSGNNFNNITISKIYGYFDAGKRGATLYLSADTYIVNNTSTTVAWAGAQTNTDAFWDFSSRLTIPSGKGISKVRLSAGVMWSADSTGSRDIVIQKNGTGAYYGSAGSTINAAPAIQARQSCLTPFDIPVVDGDYFTLVVSQNSGSTLQLLGTSNRCWMALEVIE